MLSVEAVDRPELRPLAIQTVDVNPPRSNTNKHRRRRAVNEKTRTHVSWLPKLTSCTCVELNEISLRDTKSRTTNFSVPSLYSHIGDPYIAPIHLTAHTRRSRGQLHTLEQSTPKFVGRI